MPLELVLTARAVLPELELTAGVILLKLALKVPWPWNALQKKFEAVEVETSLRWDHP